MDYDSGLRFAHITLPTLHHEVRQEIHALLTSTRLLLSPKVFNNKS